MASGASQEIGLVDARSACRRASTSKSSGPMRKAERHAAERRLRRDTLLPAGFCAGGIGLRKRRLEAKSAGAFDGAEQHLQQMDGAAGVEAVGMGGDAAHRVHRDRAADDLVVPAPGPVGPGDVEFDRLLEGDCRRVSAAMRRMASALDAAASRRPPPGCSARRVALGEELEDRHRPARRRASVELADDGGRDLRRAGARRGALSLRVPGQRIAVGVAREQPVIGARPAPG